MTICNDTNKVDLMDEILFIWMKINELMELITWMMIVSSMRLIWSMLNVIHVAKVQLRWFSS